MCTDKRIHWQETHNLLEQNGWEKHERSPLFVDNKTADDRWQNKVSGLRWKTSMQSTYGFDKITTRSVDSFVKLQSIHLDFERSISTSASFVVQLAANSQIASGFDTFPKFSNYLDVYFTRGIRQPSVLDRLLDSRRETKPRTHRNHLMRKVCGLQKFALTMETRGQGASLASAGEWRRRLTQGASGNCLAFVVG